jgi:ABC-type glycerol-3-phosphate transport system substrate-binding protein
MMRLFNTWRRATALLAALLALSACAGSAALTPTPQPTQVSADVVETPGQPDATAEPAAPGAGGVVTIGFAAPEFERQAYEPLIVAFNQQNPDVRVEFVPLGMQPSQSLDQLMRQIASSADTAATFFLRAEDVKNGLVRDLASLIDADPSFDRDDRRRGWRHLSAATLAASRFGLVQQGFMGQTRCAGAQDRLDMERPAGHGRAAGPEAR